MKPGLVSVTFRQLMPETIIDWVNRAGLQAIEWGGDVHVPHGALNTARRVGEATRQAGLEVAAYGSYYKVGVSENEGLTFDTVLATALELGAPSIRVWAGNAGSAEVDEATFAHIVAETKRVCDVASSHNIDVAFEFHGNTLTDSGMAARRLLEAANHPRLKCLWQPRVGVGVEERLHDLRLVAPWLLNLHVFYWHETAEGKRERRPLHEGESAWQRYLREANNLAAPRYALLEFLRDDAPTQLLEDGEALRGWCDEDTSHRS